EAQRRVAVLPRAAQGELEAAAKEDPDRPLRHLEERALGLAALRLGDERAVLEDAVVVHAARDEHDVLREPGLLRALEDRVEEARLRVAELAVAREAALEEDPLRHVPERDRLHVAREDAVVELLLVPAPHEVAADRLE